MRIAKVVGSGFLFGPDVATGGDRRSAAIEGTGNGCCSWWPRPPVELVLLPFAEQRLTAHFISNVGTRCSPVRPTHR
jgi:hypothetical protein